MAKQIIWSRTAQQNRLQLLEYWANHNQSMTYSRKLNQVFEDTARLISRHPTIGTKTEILNVRIKIVKDYYFTYRESEQTIEILTIWDSRQDPDKFDKILKKGI